MPTAAFLYTALAAMTAVVLRQIGFFVNELLDQFCISLRSYIDIYIYISLSKKSHNAPFSCIIEEKGAKSWNSGEKMPGRSQ